MSSNLIHRDDALQAHPEYLNEKIEDHEKAIYAKGWNACNKEYYNAISELPAISPDDFCSRVEVSEDA